MKPPKRSHKELAEEFGITPNQLNGLLVQYNGPKALLKHNSFSGRNSWYDPVEMRKWYKGLNI